jgi:polysaccharide pyruvyl transferase WcaK-like protein
VIHRTPSLRGRIGLFGLFGSGNTGNDGSLEAMLLFLREVRPDARIVCFCSAREGAPDRLAGSLDVAAIPFGLPKPANALLQLLDRLSLKGPRLLLSWIGAIRHARKLGVLIVPGTGILDDFGEGPFGMPATLFGWCLAARLCGARIAFVSIGAGPIHHPVSRWLMRSAVAMAHYRSYRDTVSKAFMESIGFDTHADAVYPDVAFGLPAPGSAPRDAKERPLSVGVGVMTYLGWHNDSSRGGDIYAAYLATITKFVLWLVDRGHDVRLLMGDAADRRAIADVRSGVASARPHLPQDRLLFDPAHSLHDLMRQIARTDVVVATRFHNVVCALKLGRPTISIGYADKNDVLMAEMGLGRFCQHVERLDLDLLIDQFTELLADRPRYERSLSHMNRAYRERLCEQELFLVARVLQGRRPASSFERRRERAAGSRATTKAGEA